MIIVAYVGKGLKNVLFVEMGLDPLVVNVFHVNPNAKDAILIA